MKKLLKISIITTAIVTLLFTYSLAAQVEFSLGHVDNPNSHSGVGAEAFAKEVDKLSNGEMKVNVFHSGKLGNQPVQIQNVYSGSQDMHLIYPELMASHIEETKLIGLPYLFQSLEHAQKFFLSDIWQPANAKIESNGAVLLDKTWSWWCGDPRGFISVRPVFSPSDMKGIKMRIWESKVAIESWEGFGAHTTVVPRAEMYLAFKQGIIEGGPEPIGISYDAKNVECAKYWILTGEYYQIINIMMNKKKYESLSKTQQDILKLASKNAGATFYQASKANFDEKKRKANLEYDLSFIEPALKPWRIAGEKTVEKLIQEKFIDRNMVNRVKALEK